ncbi:hypothetical protein Gohar_001510 [Gossypium harknessii]|uniref:Uncharacterized protein n=1 Tax=Gossypium harknessii TaxID=34285 RepID=A0A7J9I460_9ROSI|nr:hypothetical protein [Gossypium harknessii]
MAAKTNFPYNPTALQSSSSSSKLLSATYTTKLHKCYMASFKMTKQQYGQGTQNKAPTPHVDSNNGIAAGTDNGKGVVSVVEKRPLLPVQETEANWVVKKAKVETTQQFIPLEEDHIEQTIEELLHYSSIELFNFNV